MASILTRRAFAGCIIAAPAIIRPARAQIIGGGITHNVAFAPPPPGSCPFGTALPDGCPSAPTGTAQFPTILNGYAARPGWNVAGVDYAVGNQAGQTFANPITSPPAGTSYSSGVLKVDSDNVTIDGYDFSVSGGVLLYNISGHNNLTIKNCKWAGANLRNTSTAVIDSRGNGFSITYCVLDGGADGTAGSPPQSSLISLSNGTSSGNITLQYNYFKNYCQHVLEAISKCNLDYRYNLIGDTPLSPGSHNNYVQWSGGTGITAVVSYNTTYQGPLLPALLGGEGFQFYFNVSGTFTSPVFSNNTIICLKNGASGTMSTLCHGSNAGETTGGTNDNNYFDTTGSILALPAAAFNNGSMTSGAGWASSGNIDMLTGSTITPHA